MATIDSLDIQIAGSSKKANDAIDSLITNLGRLANSLKIDTSGLEKIGKSFSFSNIDKVAKNIQSQTQKVSKSLSQITEQYKDLGKGFEIKGSTQQIQKQIDALTNKLANAKLAKDDFESSGKTNLGGYETAVKNVIKYTNQIESLKNQLAGLQTAQPKLDFNITGTENATKYLIEYKKQLMDFKNDMKSIGDVYGGLQNVPKGFLDTPIQNLKQSIEELKQSYPQATNVISAFEKELQKLQGISAVLTRGPTRINFDTNSIDKINEKISELKNKFDKVGSDFKFTGNFEQLNIEIEKVYSKLNELRAKEQEMISAGRVNTSGFEQLQESLARVGNKFGIMQDLRDRTEAFNQSLKDLRVPEIREENLAKLQNSLRKTEEETEKLRTKLSNAITMGKIIPNIDDSGFRKLTEQIALSEKQAEALRQKIKEVSEAGGGGDVGKLGKELSNLSTNGSKTGTSLNKASGSIFNLSSRASSSVTVINKMANSLRGLMRTLLPILGIRQLFSWGKQAIEVSSDLTEVQNVVDTTFGDMAYRVEEFAETSIEKFGMSELALKQYSSRFQSMGVAMGISSRSIENANSFLEKQTGGYIKASNSMADMSLNLTKLTADMASFYNVEQDVVAEKLASVFTGQTRPLRDFGLDLTQATLQEWALSQGMQVNMKTMTQAEKTMLRYQYVLANTTAAQGDFARTANTWANQVRILKQSFQQLAGIVGGTLINAFKPLIQALNSVMGKVIAFAETVTNALGSIFGWQFESGGTGGLADDFSGMAGDSGDIADNLGDAAGGAGGTADNLGDAAKNIEKMNKGIRKFDELINITMPETSEDSGNGGGGGGKPSGGGSGAGLGAGGAEGSLVKTDTIFDKYKSDIDSLYELGEYIGDTLSKVMESIDWDSVYEKARGFGKGLAEFLNGLISPRLFGNIGKTIAGSLNTALHVLDSFGEEFDWKNFGLSIASGINNFFSTFDFTLLASTINKWVRGVWATLKTAISNINWKDVWNGAKDFLNNIDLETVAIIIGALTIKKILGMHLASSALSFVGTTISKKIAQAIAGKLGVEIAANAGIGTALATGLKAAFSKISGLGILDIGTVLGAGTLAEKFAFISKMIGGIGLVIGGVITAVKNFFGMWENGWNVVGEILKDVGIALAAIGAVILGVAAAPAAIVAAVVAAVSTIVIVIHDNWNTICEWLSGVAEWINANVIQPVIGFFQGFWTSVSGFFFNLWNDIVGVWSLVSGWFNENVITPVVGFFQGLWLRVKQIFEGLWIIIQAIWITVSGWFNENVITPVVGFFQGLWESVSGFFKKLWGDIQYIWITVSGWFKTNVTEPVTRFFKGVWTNVKGYFANLWSNIKGVWKDASGWFKRTVITPVQNAWKTATDKIKGFFTSLWNSIKTGVKSAFNSVIASIESGINAIVNGINTAINGFNRVAQWAANVVGVNYGGVSPVPTVSLPRLEKGGITLKHIFAEIGEHNKPEAVLPLTNKRTMGMIADSILENSSYNKYSNGYKDDYTRQLEEATYRGTMRAIQEAGGIKADVTFQVEGDPNRIFRVTQKEAEDFFKRTGRPAYSF